MPHPTIIRRNRFFNFIAGKLDLIPLGRKRQLPVIIIGFHGKRNAYKVTLQLI